MREFYESHRDAVDKAVFFLLVVVSVYVFFNYLFRYVAPFFFGLIVSLMMEPVIRLLMKRVKFKRGLAAILCLLLFMFAVGSIGTLIVSNVSRQVGALVENAPAYIDEINDKLDDANNSLWDWMDKLPPSLQFEYTDIKDTLINGLAGVFGDGFRSQSWRLVSNVPDFLVGVILMMVSAFFFMKDRALIFAAASRVCPPWLARNLRLMRRGLSRAVGGYFKAQFILMSIVGTISIAALLIMRNPYALLIGLIMAMVDFLPFLGSGTILIPWALFNLVTGQFHLAIGLLVLYGILIITRQVMEPKILGEQIGIHPLLTLITMYAGFRVFGIPGIIIGPSLVIIGKAVLEAERLGDAPPPSPPPRAERIRKFRKNK
ncbi:MAG: sporulation integral membrane protein YtvI [Clostridiales bacterium]|jgi:sporulation integral membrane protein YtvI|nr:sporulation integral membrane protein YtvI [Clostridiales bacterium]